MRRIILTVCIAFAALSASAQTVSNNYGDLRAKVLHVGQKLTGQNTTNDQAIAVIVRELAMNYQGRLSRLQFQELKDTIEGMLPRVNDDRWRTVLNGAIIRLREKTDTLDIQQRILDYYRQVPQEIIYVHTDRPYYVPGDTVWFRAHLVDAVTHTPISRSRYVYAELLDNAADTLVQRIIVKCDSDGVFANAILLSKTIKGGSYTLAAYTQWMRNFPVERFYYKQLTVVDNSTSVVVAATASVATESRHATDPKLILAQRKGQLLIQYSEPTHEPLSCVLYGSGNLIVTDYTSGKVLRIDSHTLRPGNLCIAIVNRETGDVITEKQTIIEGSQPQIAISGKARTQNEPMELSIDLTEADGTPLNGSFSLSVTDYDVVKPDTLQPTIDKYLNQQSDAYPLADILSRTYPRIDYGFQTSQTITGRVKGTWKKRLKNPHLLVVNGQTGERWKFELGDSTHFSLGVDNPEGSTFLLEGTRNSGKTAFVELQIDSLTFPKIALPHYAQRESPDLSAFRTQAQAQQMYSRTGYIDLPEVTKIGKRQKPLKNNFLNFEAPRGFQEGDPRIERAVTMQQLLISLGMRVGYADGSAYITTPDNAGVLSYVDNIREEDHEYVLNLLPTDVKSIEYFTPNNAINGFFAARPANYGKVPGVLFIFLKDGSEIVKSRAKDSPSFVSVRQLGYRPAVEFYSPQYPDPSAKTRPDHRTTLYWNPKVETDEKGHASVRFYASDISKRYLITLEGVSNDGTIVHHQQIME